MKHIILDTDISNEIDDQFALAYLVKSLDGYSLDAITIAPFSNSAHIKTNTLDEANNISFNTTKKILKMLNRMDLVEKIYLGASEYYFQSKVLNSASKKIIDIARENEFTTIIAIGAITNVAIAIYHAPDIINKIEVIWLGGHSFLQEKNDEYNFVQDIEGVNAVLSSGAYTTVIPCKNVASHLATTICELDLYLKKEGEIGQYLTDLFKYTVRRFSESENTLIGASYILWDLSAVAYLLDKQWFDVSVVNVLGFNDDMTYNLSKNGNKIQFVNYLDRDKILRDFFIKMKFC